MTLRHIAMSMIIIAAFFIALWFAADFLVDWLWFSTVGYLNVFLTIFGTKVALFIAVFVTSALFLWLNGALAHRLAKRKGYLPPPTAPWGSNDQTLTAALQRLSPGLPWRFLIIASALALAALITLGEVGSWDIALRFIG